MIFRFIVNYSNKMILFSLLSFIRFNGEHPPFYDEHDDTVYCDGHWFDLKALDQYHQPTTVTIDRNTVVYSIASSVEAPHRPSGCETKEGISAFITTQGSSDGEILAYEASEMFYSHNGALVINYERLTEQGFHSQISFIVTNSTDPSPPPTMFKTTNELAILIHINNPNIYVEDKSPPSITKPRVESCVFDDGLTLMPLNLEGKGYFMENGEQSFVLIQPCREVKVPRGYTGDGKEAPFVICKADTKACKSYGNWREEFVLDVKDSNTYQMKFNDITLQYSCENESKTFIESVLLSTPLVTFKSPLLCDAKASPQQVKIGDFQLDQDLQNLVFDQEAFQSNMKFSFNMKGLDINRDDFKGKCVMWVCIDDVCKCYGPIGTPARMFVSGPQMSSSRVLYLGSFDGDSAFIHLVPSNEQKIESIEYDDGLHVTIKTNNLGKIQYIPAPPDPTVTPEPIPPKGETIWITTGNNSQTVSLEAIDFELTQDVSAPMPNTDITVPAKFYYNPYKGVNVPKNCSMEEELAYALCCFGDRCLIPAEYKSSIDAKSIDPSTVRLLSLGQGDFSLQTDIQADERNPLLAFNHPKQLSFKFSKESVRMVQLLQPTPPPYVPREDPPEEQGAIRNSKGALDQFSDSKFDAVILSNGLNYSQEIVIGFNKTLPCPEGANCSEEKTASIWRCWENADDGRICYPIADTRYGQTIEGMKTRVNGGLNGVSTLITFECDASQKDSVQQTGTWSEVNGNFSINLASSSFCQEQNNLPIILGVTIPVVVIAIVVVVVLVVVRKKGKEEQSKKHVYNEGFVKKEDL